MGVKMDLYHFISAALLALPAAWLTIGVWENIRHPVMNETYTAEVLSMARLKHDYPQLFNQIGTRAIQNRGIQRLAFYAIVGAELGISLALWAGAGAHIFVPDMALTDTLGKLAILGFCSLWGSFLVVGNYFAYWMCHDIAQNTHFQMLFWGLGILIFLFVGS